MYSGDAIAIILGVFLFVFLIIIISIFATVSINCQDCFIRPLPPHRDPCLNEFYRQIQSKLIGNGSIGSLIYQGTSVSISDDGNTIVVGAPGDDNFIGGAFVYINQDGKYIQFGPKLVGKNFLNFL
jgi:hypothetical protein